MFILFSGIISMIFGLSLFPYLSYSACRELWNIANMQGLALTVRDICDALMLLPPPPTTTTSTIIHSINDDHHHHVMINGFNEDMKLAVALQRATDVYVTTLRANPPPGDRPPCVLQ